MTNRDRNRRMGRRTSGQLHHWLARHPSFECPWRCPGITKSEARSYLKAWLRGPIPSGTTFEQCDRKPESLGETLLRLYEAPENVFRTKTGNDQRAEFPRLAETQRAVA